MARSSLADYIQTLDPQRDCQEIMRLLVGREFPFDYQRAMIDLVFLKGLAAPRVAGLIFSNRYFQAFPQKRYDDTAIFVMEFVKHGYESPRGRAALERMNQIHARFVIRQEDYLYVLVGLMLEPIDWIARFGWRELTETERQAHYWFWRGVGERIDLTIIPPSYDATRRFKADYEARYFRRTRAGAALADVMFGWVEGRVPWPLRRGVRPLIASVLEEPFLSYFDLAGPPRALRRAVEQGLRARARIAAHLPTRAEPRFYMDRPLKSYPRGYGLADLGPPDAWRNSGARTPRHSAGEVDRFCHHRLPAAAPEGTSVEDAPQGG